MTVLLKSIDLSILLKGGQFAINVELHPCIHYYIPFYNYKGLAHFIVCLLYCIIKIFKGASKGLGGGKALLCHPSNMYITIETDIIILEGKRSFLTSIHGDNYV